MIWVLVVCNDSAWGLGFTAGTGSSVDASRSGRTILTGDGHSSAEGGLECKMGVLGVVARAGDGREDELAARAR